MNKNVTIQQLDPNTFEYQTYSDSDSQLIVQSQLDTVFSASTDYIEYYVYDQNQNLIYPGSTIPLLDYDVRNGDVLLNPQKDLTNSGFDIGTYNILYTFYRKRLASNISEKYFISDISSDRTEIRLDSNIISNNLIISSSNLFIQYRETADYFVDFYLNFGNNQTVIANNIKLETEEGIDPTVLIKLYEPLPSNFNVKDELWVVEELSDPQAYELDFPFEPIIEDDFTYIAGPNYNLNIIQETSTGGEAFSFSTLLQSDVTSSINQIQNLLNQKEIDININYENYANFIHFSSAKIRLENFYYKVGLIESASNQLSQVFTTTSPTSTTLSYIESKALLTNQIDNIIKNFDGYESFLYFNSGSQYSYPKTNQFPPYQLASTGSTEALTWIGNATVGDPYYGGQALSASNYDQDNRNWLYWSIPEYLRDDPANEGYELFVDMVAQYYDNVWVYTKDISNKFDADNRLEYGIAKDLVADAIRDFGVKLYANNFNTNDLFTAFLGLTPSGSAFPFPNMTGSVVDGSGNLDIPSGFEYVDTEISASNDIVPLNNVQKQVYKRIYHNIPYLLKTKGTIAGIRALITSYGIPDTILRISEFGGKDRNESQDYDLKQNVFNYAFDTGTNAQSFVSSSLLANQTFWNPGGGFIFENGLNTVQFRFKSPGIPAAVNNVASSDIREKQLLWINDANGNDFTQIGSAVVLEYNGAGFVTGSYSGSIPDPYDTWGTLKFYPDLGFSNQSIDIYLPFFNKDWWSVQMNFTGSGIFGSTSTVTASLFAANEINGKIGFSGSGQLLGVDGRSWTKADFGALNLGSNRTIDSNVYEPFSGSFQEYRMYCQAVSESRFFDYTVNPYSNEGNGINSTPDQQFFRAALGTQLDTGSRTSIHPRVTGSAIQITQSFSDGTSDYFITSPIFRDDKLFVTNVEDIFQDQVPAGIKNRITDKIYNENLILAEAPYGISGSTAVISSPISDVISPMESIQQQSFVSQSYTPNVNYLEVGFSPSNQINDDINAQLGYFNLGDYIGDPRFISSSLDSYPDLDRLRDAYFEKYIKGYDIVDFIRLIKFFDNSLFKMIKDFTPARTSLASGVIVKQHLLERNRLRPAQVSSSLHDYEGLIVNLPKDYSSGSADFPQYSTEGSAIYKFSGGPGGSFNKFNGLETYISGSKGLGPDNRFNLTQSWTESFDYGAIDRSVVNSLFFHRSSSQYISASYKGIKEGVIHNDQSEFYNGIFSGSYVEITNGDLNPGCEPYLNITDTPIFYKPIFFTTTPDVQLYYNEPGFNVDNASWQVYNGATVQQSSIQETLPNIDVTFNPTIITRGAGATANLAYRLNNIITLGRSYRYSVWAKQGTTMAVPKIVIDIADSTETTPVTFDLTGEYQKFTVTATANRTPQSTYHFVDIQFSGASADGDDMSIAWVEIEEIPNYDIGTPSPISQNTFLNQNNFPINGYAWIASQQINADTNEQQVYAVKLSQIDINGTEVINYLDDFSELRFLFDDAKIPFNSKATEYKVLGRTIFSEHALLRIDQRSGVGGNNYQQTVGGIVYYPITSSDQGGSMDWSLETKTSYSTINVISTQSSDNTQQNVLANPNISIQEQNIYYWNGDTKDELGFFNTGSGGVNTGKIINTDFDFFKNSAYTIPYTPNIPWVISASVVYSSSFNSAAAIGTQEDVGVYHSGSFYQGAGMTNQDFRLGTNRTLNIGLIYVDYNSNGYDTAQDAFDNADIPSITDNQVFVDVQGGFSEVIVQYDFFNATNAYKTVALNSPPVLTVGKYYKFANGVNYQGTPTFFVAQMTNTSSLGSTSTLPAFRFGDMPTTLRYPTNGTPQVDNQSIIPAPAAQAIPTLFRPAPLFVEGLGTVAFNGNLEVVKQQIPGNSGSGTPLTTFGGHSKIKTGGTASMDWSFPSLTLAGTIPNIDGVGNNLRPFSGSYYSTVSALTQDFTPDYPTDLQSIDTSLSNVWNSDVAYSLNVSPSDFSAINYLDGPAGEEYDGSFLLNVQQVQQTLASNLPGVTYSQLGLVSISVKVSASISATDPSQTFTVALKEQTGVGAGFYTQPIDPSVYTPINTIGYTTEQISPIQSIGGVVDIDEVFTANPLLINSHNAINQLLPYCYRYIFQVQNTNRVGENLEYTFEVHNFAIQVEYSINGTTIATKYPGNTLYGPIMTGSGAGNLFQNTSNALKYGTNTYASAKIDVFLKRTGSEGDFIITQSEGYTGSVYDGGTFTFEDSPINTIFNDSTTDSDRTINKEGDMYYVEYSASQFANGKYNSIARNFQDFDFQTNSDKSTILITQSYEVPGTGQTFNATGSILVRQGNTQTPTSLGTIVDNLDFILDENANGLRVDLTGSFTGLYNVNDTFRFSVRNTKTTNASSLFIQSITASIVPSQSIWSEIKDPFEYNNFRIPQDTGVIVPSYYPGVLPFNFAVNCQPLLNNYNLQRLNPYLMDIDYNFQGNSIYYSSSLAPVNFIQILSGSAVRANVPVSNYTQFSSISPRYLGAKSTSQELNVWNIGDVGTYGKNPTIELRDAFFGYFNDLDDPYPNINGLTRVNLNYLIDEQGNALPPSIQPITIDTFKAVFPTTTLGKIAVKSGKNQYKILGDPAPIERLMEYVSPVIYSQNSSNNYTNVIPLSGSGYISRYDNDDENSIQFGRFTALGTASINTNFPQQEVEYYLDPSEAVTLPNQTENIDVWSAGNNEAAKYSVNSWNGSIGDDLGNEQIISMQTSIVTTYVSETNRTRDELQFEIHMETGSQDPSTEVPFNLEDITAKIYTSDGNVRNIGSVLEYSWFNFQNIVNYERKVRKRGFNWFRNRWKYSYVPVPTGGIVCTADWEMYNTLIDLGIYRNKVHTEIAYIEWIITANSGAYTIKVGDEINWRIKGKFKTGTRSNEPQGMFFPFDYPGSYTPVNIQGQGANDYLLAEANTAQAPFWVRSTSGNDALNPNNNNLSNVLIMSSSNMNEAYGTTFRQGDMEYFPGPSQYFPGGVEPKGTNFDPIKYTISLQEGDEIRFGNNENFTYRILEVFAPSENIVGGKGRLKIVVNGKVPTSVNGDFFLVRRPVVNPNSLYLDQPFPYATLSSASRGTFITTPGATGSFALTSSNFLPSGSSDDGSYTASFSDLEISSTPGILYPDFPTEYLVQSASIIVNDLISKGIIES
jgi:hypothetical protein